MVQVLNVCIRYITLRQTTHWRQRGVKEAAPQLRTLRHTNPDAFQTKSPSPENQLGREEHGQKSLMLMLKEFLEITHHFRLRLKMGPQNRPTSESLEPENMTFCGKKDFADIIKGLDMGRFFWILQGGP